MVNDILASTNEPEISTVATTRGVQTVALNSVNRAIHNLVNKEIKWPFTHSTTEQTLTVGVGVYSVASTIRQIDFDTFWVRPADLITNGNFASDITSWTDKSSGSGTAAHTSDGDGRCRLTGGGTDPGAIEQSISTVVGKSYRLVFRHFTTDIAVRIGTSSGGTETHSETVELGNAGQGEWAEIEFEAEATTTYIGFYNTSTTAGDVDHVFVRRNVRPRPLQYLSYDDYVYRHKEDDDHLSPERFNLPKYIYQDLEGDLGVTPLPDEAYVMEFSHWDYLTDLSDDSDTTVIPTQYHDVVTAFGKQEVALLRSDPANGDRWGKQYEEGVMRMRRDLINRKEYAQAR